MKITYIHQHFAFPDEPGGSRPWEFGRRLAADGHSVTMICGGSEPLDEHRNGMRIIRLRSPYSNKMSVPARMQAFVKFLVGASVKAAIRDADLVIASSTPLTVAIPGIAAKSARRARFVFEVRDLWPKVPIELGLLKNKPVIIAAKLLERIVYRSADEVIALSPSMVEGVQQVDPKVRVTLVPNSADVETFARTPEERLEIRNRLGWGSEKVLVYCGSFGHSYDLQWTIRLAARAASSQVRIVLIGDGASTDELRELCKREGLEPSRILLGAKPKSEAADYVSAADAVISTLIDHPSLEGNSLNKVFDAMAASRPVVFNHRGWLAETMQERGAGWILDRDVDIAAEELRKLLEQEDLLAAGRTTSEKLGTGAFSRDHLYTQFKTAVERVSNPRPA